MNEQTTNPAGEWPLWRAALATLRKLPDFGYGFKRPGEYFEQQLGYKSETAAFAFQMMPLRKSIEAEDGYYLESQTVVEEVTGIRMVVWQIPSAAEHEAVGVSFDGSTRSYASRAVNIRLKTLANSAAVLSVAERKKMEASCRIAATRQILLSREKSVAALVDKHAPNLLK